MDIKQNVTPSEVMVLSQIVAGCQRGAHITVAVNGDVGNLLTGTMRHLTEESGDARHASYNANIWDMFVRVSATFEHWFPVRELVSGLVDGMVAIEGKE